MAKILISAGEASGDIHAAAVTAAIKKLDSKAEVFGMGGDALRQAGGEVLWDIKDHGVMGFVEVIRKLPDLFRLRSDFARSMDERKPDCLVVVDYPGFNMKLAKLAHDKGIPVHVWVDETRPGNQGARLTAFELGNYGVPYTLITDNCGGQFRGRKRLEFRVCSIITGGYAAFRLARALCRVTVVRSRC